MANDVTLMLGAVGVGLGSISLIFCIIQAIIIARLFKKISCLSIEHNTRSLKQSVVKDVPDRTDNNEAESEDDTEGVALVSEEYDDVIVPTMVMQPLQRHQQKPSYQSSQLNSLESFLDDSPSQGHTMLSPTVAELKNSLELPLKKVFDRSCTLDSRIRTPTNNQSQMSTTMRPRAQTSNCLTGSDYAPTPSGRSESESPVGTPGSSGSPCKTPIAYVVTEIVDATDTKKRPSIRLRESRPKRSLSKKIQKQLEKPEPFYFGLEKTMPNKMKQKEDRTPSPLENRDVGKRWRQVLPIVTDRNKVLKSCDENDNTCPVSPNKDDPSSRNTNDNNINFKQKVALKPPATKARPVLEKSSSVGILRGGTWSPKTLEKHRMILGAPGERCLEGRIRAGSLRERAPSPYELVEAPSTRSVTCAEEVGCYSKMIRPHDGRRRASSIGSSDVSGRSNDRSYNKLMIGV